MAYGYRGGAASTKMLHDWANQIGTGKSVGSVFWEGDTIYSYGHHFPIAKHLDNNTIAFTTRSYSNTTASHKSAVSSAASHKRFIYCHHIPKHARDKFTAEYHKLNIEHWEGEVEQHLKDMAGAKQERSRVRIAGETEATRQQAREYIAYFDIKLTKLQNKKLFEATFGDWTELVKKEQAVAKRKKQALIVKGAKLHPLWLEMWRGGGNEWQWKQDNKVTDELWRAIQTIEDGDSRGNSTRLRVNNYTIEEKRTLPRVEVETSKGLRLPADVARRYYRKYLAVVRAGGCGILPHSDNCDYKMLEYPVRLMSADRLVVGCHDIARSEIDYIAKAMGWA